jgi:DNA-binding MarR family transcriptional regulator
LVGLADKAARALAADMVSGARERGYPEIRMAHNAVFSTLGGEPARTSDMAARAGITKQSMGEVVRELVELGICQVETDPEDGRAKLVSYTDYGIEITQNGQRHMRDLERRLVKEFGEDYEGARRVLEWVIKELSDG